MTNSLITNSVFVVTTHLMFENGYSFPIVQAFFDSKKTAKAFLKGVEFKGEIKKIDPTDYTLTMQRVESDMPIVLLNGSRFYRDMEKAKAHFQAMRPNDIIQVMKFDETEIYKQTILDARKYHENRRAMYA